MNVSKRVGIGVYVSVAKGSGQKYGPELNIGRTTTTWWDKLAISYIYNSINGGTYSFSETSPKDLVKKDLIITEGVAYHVSINIESFVGTGYLRLDVGSVDQARITSDGIYEYDIIAGVGGRLGIASMTTGLDVTFSNFSLKEIL